MPEEDIKIGENIKKRRLALKLSQEELAAKMGYASRSTISKIEDGTNDITQTKILAFAKALDTTPAYLMGWTDYPHADAVADMYGWTDKPTSDNVLDEIPSTKMSDKDIMFALTDGEATEEISDEVFQEVKNYAKYVIEKKKRIKNDT